MGSKKANDEDFRDDLLNPAEMEAMQNHLLAREDKANSCHIHLLHMLSDLSFSVTKEVR